MPAPRKKSGRKAKAPGPRPIAAPKSGIPDEASESFVRNVVTRGEAAPAGEELPPGATHEIVGKEEDGTPKLVRKRFSAF